jgi:hypothetical protein
MSEPKDISRQRLTEFLAARLRARTHESNESKQPPHQPRRPVLNTYADENASSVRLSE